MQERVDKKMLELMKVREKRKEKEKESKKIGKFRWSSLGLFASSIFWAFFHHWFIDNTAEYGQWVVKFFKFIYWAFIVLGILGLIMGIYFIFVGYPKSCEEVKQLKRKEKQLEQEIASQ